MRYLGFLDRPQEGYCDLEGADSLPHGSVTCRVLKRQGYGKGFHWLSSVWTVKAKEFYFSGLTLKKKKKLKKAKKKKKEEDKIRKERTTMKNKLKL